MYDVLAPWYDALTGNIGYRRRARFLHRTFKAQEIGGIILDAGCGTGNLTGLLARKGYEMIGVDGSEAMLSVARSKRIASRILYLQQNLEELDLYGTVKGVVCMQDTLNHLGDALPEAIRRFSLFTEPGGLFVFDINTLYKMREILGNSEFQYKLPDGICVWRNEREEENRRVRLTIETRFAHGVENEEFYEYDISTQEISEHLHEHGYTVISVLDGETYRQPADTTQRLLYVAKKTGDLT